MGGDIVSELMNLSAVYAAGCVLVTLVVVYPVWLAIRRYRTQRARRRAAGPLQVVTPQPREYGDLLGIEFTVVTPDFIRS